MIDAVDRLRGDPDARVSGLHRRQPSQDAVHPVRHRAERVVVERGHLARVDAAVGQHRVPPFPDRRRAHRDRVEPGRALPLEQQPSGDVDMPGTAQGIQDVRRAGEAGRDAVTGCHDQVGEIRSGPRPLVVVEQPEDDREGVGGLAVVAQPACTAIDVGVAERRAGAVPQNAELVPHLRATENTGDAERQVGRTVEAGGGAELESAVPETGCRYQRVDVTQVGQHPLEVLDEHTSVSGCHPHRPRHPDDGVAPHGGRIDRGDVLRHADVLQDIRHHVRNDAALVLLLGRHVAKPVPEEVLDVEEVGTGRREDGDVARPPQSLVALRAVRGQVDEVAERAVDDVLVESIQEGLRTRERPGAAQTRTDPHGFDTPSAHGVQPAGPAVDLDVAEPVERESRLEHVVAAGQDEPVGGTGRAEGTDADLTVLEDLGVTQRHDVARVTRHPRAHPADEVLAEVDDDPAARRRPGIFHAQGLQGHHRWADVGLEPVAGLVNDAHRLFRGVAPPAPSVDGLAVVEVVGEDAARAHRPPFVGPPDLGVAVLEQEVDLGDGRQLVAVHGGGAHPGQASPVPPVTQGELERRPRRDERRHVGLGDAEAPLVARPPGGEELVGDAGPVEHRLHDPEGGVTERGPDDTTVPLVEGEPADEGGSAVDGCGRRDQTRDREHGSALGRV